MLRLASHRVEPILVKVGRTMKRVRVVMVVLVALFGLGACSADSEGSVNDDPPRGENADVGNEGEDSADTAEAVDEPEEPSNPVFGDAYTYDSGLTVKVSKPRKFVAGEWAAGAEEPGTSLRFTITIVNKTGAAYDAGVDYITMQSGNKEASEIFDSENGLDGMPMTKVLDGREATYDIAFHVQKPKDLVMEYQPQGFEDEYPDSVVFTTPLG